MNFLKDLLNNISFNVWAYPKQNIKWAPPIYASFSRYRMLGDSPILLNLVHNGTNMSGQYVSKCLLPRNSEFTRMANSSNEVASIASDANHPISILADKRARFFIQTLKEANKSTSVDNEAEARAFASLATLVIDGFTVAMVEKKISGISWKGSTELLIIRACYDFLIAIAARNWSGDAGNDVGIFLNRPLNKYDESSPPPFGPSPPDPLWGIFRYLIDYGFYCGVDYVDKGKRSFEKSWSSILQQEPKPYG